MSTTNLLVMHNNQGIVNTGDQNRNELVVKEIMEIEWDKLNNEISTLKLSPDSSIKNFAHEAGEVAEKKDKQELRKTLAKWIPSISHLISSSYYILEIAKIFGLLNN